MAMANPNNNPSNNTNSGKITLKIGNLNTLENSCSSPVSKIGGFKWHLDVSKTTAINGKQNAVEGPFLNVNIFCKLDDAPVAWVEKLWMCKAVVKLTFGQFGFAQNDVSKSAKFHFFNGHICHSWTEPLAGLPGPENFWIAMEVLVQHHNLHLSMATLETDLELHFNGKEEMLAVNKFVLAGFSSYFRNLFFGNWSEQSDGGDQDKFSIKEDEDFDLPAFKLMLYSAMAMGWMVHKGKFLRAPTALAILKLSIKYDVPMLQDYCQKYLPEAQDCAKMELLEVAEQLGLQQMKDHCLATITAADVAENFGHNAEICARLGKRTRELLDERLNESAKKVRQQQQKQLATANAVAVAHGMVDDAIGHLNAIVGAVGAAGAGGNAVPAADGPNAVPLGANRNAIAAGANAAAAAAAGHAMAARNENGRRVRAVNMWPGNGLVEVERRQGGWRVGFGDRANHGMRGRPQVLFEAEDVLNDPAQFGNAGFGQ